MAECEMGITVSFNKKDLVPLAELISIMNEVCELVPDWQQVELKKLTDEISDKLGELLEAKRG